mgnify:CR=1 FL=1
MQRWWTTQRLASRQRLHRVWRRPGPGRNETVGTNRRDRQRGFTLIELGVVLAILAILAAVAVPTYAAMVKRSRRAEAQQVWNMVRTELWTYYLENNEFPETSGNWWQGIDPAPQSSYWNYAGSSEDNPASATLTATAQQNANEKMCWTLNADGTVSTECE